MHAGISSQIARLSTMRDPWRNLEFRVLFKGTLESFCEQPPFIVEYIVLSQTFLQKGDSKLLAVCVVSPSCEFVIRCLVQGQSPDNWSFHTDTTDLLQLETEPATLQFSLDSTGFPFVALKSVILYESTRPQRCNYSGTEHPTSPKKNREVIVSKDQGIKLKGVQVIFLYLWLGKDAVLHKTMLDQVR